MIAEQRAGRHALAVVHRLVLADGREQHVVLPLVHVVLLAGEGPVGLAFDARHGAAADGAGAFGAQDVIGILVVAARDLAVGQEGAHAVRVDVVDFEVVVDVAALGRNRAAADADAAHRRLVVHRPRDLVDAVDRLLHQAVAAQPHEVVPVADLPLDVAHAGGPRAGRRHRLHRVGVVGGVVGHQLADRAVLHLLEGVLDHVVVAPAEAGDQRSGSSARAFSVVSSTERTPGASVAIGFSQNTCLLASMQAARCMRAEARRRGQQHHVHAAVDHLLEGVQAQVLLRPVSTFTRGRALLRSASAVAGSLSICAWSISATAVSSA